MVRQCGAPPGFAVAPGPATAVEGIRPRTQEAVPTPAANKRAAGARGTETVIVVEDDRQVRTVVRNVLRQQGYQVLEAGNGEEALWEASRHQGPIHLLLTDVVLPRTDSRDLVDHLKELRPGLKVLYCSGYPEDSLARHGVSPADAPFLSKPFLPATLAQKAREVLHR
jgi:CheY-like chemotaxis protein